MTRYNTEVIDGVTYTLYADQDDLYVRGNALSSGDPDADRVCEDEILERLDNGDIWAWASVKVEASIEVGDIEFTGEDYLGACSYKSYKDFIQPGDYYDDMKAEALDRLIEDIERHVNAAGAMAVTLKALKARAAK